jgi:hypothetical protein
LGPRGAWTLRKDGKNAPYVLFSPTENANAWNGLKDRLPRAFDSDTVEVRGRQQLLERAAAIFAGQTPDELSRQKIDELERVIGQLTVELAAAKKLSALLS